MLTKIACCEFSGLNLAFKVNVCFKSIISMFISISVFVAGNGYAQPGCFDLASNDKTYLANSKATFDRPTELMIIDPSKVWPTQKYDFCEQIMTYGFYDLANIACFDIEINKLTERQRITLEYNQAVVHSTNLDFSSAYSGIDSAIDRLGVAIKKTHNETESNELLYDSLELLSFKNWLNYLLFPNKDHKQSGEKLNAKFERLSSESCFLTIPSFIKLSTLALHGNSVSNDIKNLVGFFDKHSCHQKLENLVLPRVFVYEHTDISVDEKLKNIGNLLNQSRGSCDIETMVLLATSLFKLSFYEDRSAANDYLTLSKQMSEYTGSLHNKSITSWNIAIADAVDGESDKAIETFSSVCNHAKSKTSIDNKTLFGNFSFLNESDQSKVQDIYLQSSCAE